jgi:hypothetical protein
MVTVEIIVDCVLRQRTLVGRTLTRFTPGDQELFGASLEHWSGDRLFSVQRIHINCRVFCLFGRGIGV